MFWEGPIWKKAGSSEHEYNGNQFMVGSGDNRGCRRNRVRVMTIAFLKNAT